MATETEKAVLLDKSRDQVRARTELANSIVKLLVQRLIQAGPKDRSKPLPQKLKDGPIYANTMVDSLRKADLGVGAQDNFQSWRKQRGSASAASAAAASAIPARVSPRRPAQDVGALQESEGSSSEGSAGEEGAGEEGEADAEAEAQSQQPLVLSRQDAERAADPKCQFCIKIIGKGGPACMQHQGEARQRIAAQAQAQVQQQAQPQPQQQQQQAQQRVQAQPRAQPQPQPQPRAQPQVQQQPQSMQEISPEAFFAASGSRKRKALAASDQGKRATTADIFRMAGTDSDDDDAEPRGRGSAEKPVEVLDDSD